MNKKLIVFISIIIALVAIVCSLNIQVTTKYGKNYVVYEKKIPLDLKFINFIDRHLQYKQITKEITNGCTNDKDKAMAIFNWIVSNIKKQPDELPIIDDHPLNIIIRGYGTGDQFEDIFTILCTYANLPAFRQRVYVQKESIDLSFVRINNKWRVFNVYYGNYFLNKDGELAGIQDIVKDPSLVDSAQNKPVISGVAYIDFFRNIDQIDIESNINRKARSRRQMFIGRVLYDLKKTIGLIE